MEDPKSFLKNLRSKMNERSILVISVPDLKGHLVHKRKLNFMYDLQHISYFTKNKLKEILNLSGFKSLSIYQKIIVGNGSLISVSMKGNYINEIKYDYSTSKYLFQLKQLNTGTKSQCRPSSKFTYSTRS